MQNGNWRLRVKSESNLNIDLIIIHAGTNNIRLYKLGNPKGNFNEVSVLARMMSDTVICSGSIPKGGEQRFVVHDVQVHSKILYL